jgi:hypothetical protein
MRAHTFFIGAALVIFCAAAKAGDDTLVQVGKFRCVVESGLLLAPRCPAVPDIKFSKPFATPPDVAFTLESFDVALGGTGDNDHAFVPFLKQSFGMKAANITPEGFKFAQGSGINEPEPVPGIYSGSWIAVGPPQVNASVTPKYLVLTIIYAPPGMKGPKGTGTITYQEGTTVGTVTSASKSFKQAYDVSANVSGGYFGAGGGDDLSVGYSKTVSDKQSLDIKVSQTGGLKGQGSDSENGVNNDNYAIYLALNPKVNLQLAPSLVQWTFADPASFVVTHVFVAWLKNPTLFQTEAPSVKKLLQDNGITEQDYPDILKQDPLAGGVTPHADRYVLQTSFDYVPPHPCDIPPLTTTLTFQRQQTSSTEHAVQDDYDVALTHSDRVSFGSSTNGVDLTIKESGKWTWTNQSASGNSTSTTNTATLAAGGPSCGYSGATRINVLFDKIYATYAFREDTGSTALEGAIPTTPNVAPSVVTSGIGVAVTSTHSPELHLIDADGHEQRTFVNASGSWRFVGTLKFPVTVTGNGSTQVYGDVASRPLTISRATFVRK